MARPEILTIAVPNAGLLRQQQAVQWNYASIASHLCNCGPEEIQGAEPNLRNLVFMYAQTSLTTLCCYQLTVSVMKLP